MRFFITLVSIAILQSACSTLDLNRRMSSWQNMHYEQVVESWGEPDTCDNTGEQVICVWHVADPERIDAAQSASHACVRMLTVHDAGMITGWRWRGNRCARLSQRIADRGYLPAPSMMLAATGMY